MQVIFIATMLQMLIVVILLAVVFVAGKTMGGPQKGIRFFFKKGKSKKLEAKAIILNIERTGLFLNQHTQVRLEMQVIPDTGRNFVTEIKEVVSAFDLASLQSGCMVRVQYDPANPKEVELIKAA